MKKRPYLIMLIFGLIGILLSVVIMIVVGCRLTSLANIVSERYAACIDGIEPVDQCNGGITEWWMSSIKAIAPYSHTAFGIVFGISIIGFVVIILLKKHKGFDLKKDLQIAASISKYLLAFVLAEFVFMFGIGIYEGFGSYTDSVADYIIFSGDTFFFANTAFLIADIVHYSLKKRSVLFFSSNLAVYIFEIISSVFCLGTSVFIAILIGTNSLFLFALAQYIIWPVAMLFETAFITLQIAFSTKSRKETENE